MKRSSIAELEDILDVFKREFGNGSELFRALFDTNPVWTALETLEDGCYLEANPAFYKNTGYLQKNVIGRTSIEFGLWPDPRKRAAVLRRFKDNGRLESLPIRFRMSSGELHDFVWSARIVKFNGAPCSLSVLIDITRQQHSQEVLIARQRTIAEQAKQIQDLNTTLKMLRDHQAKEQKDQFETFSAGLKRSVLPYLHKVKSGSIDNVSRTYLAIMESNIKDLVSAWPHAGTSRLQDLTDTETRVADLIRQGKTSKEIAVMLKVSTATISFHRHNLRKKLGLSKKKASLMSHLRSATP